MVRGCYTYTRQIVKVIHHVTSSSGWFSLLAREALSSSPLTSPVSPLTHPINIARYSIFVCGMGAVAEFAARWAATLVVVHALRDGPLVGGPVGSFLPLTRARGETT